MLRVTLDTEGRVVAMDAHEIATVRDQVFFCYSGDGGEDGGYEEPDSVFIESDDFIQDMLDSIEGNLKVNQDGIEIAFSEIPQSEVRPTTA